MRRAESPSSIELYHNCPLAYRLCYIDGVPAADLPYLEVGRAFHEVAAGYEKHCAETGLRTDLEHLEELARQRAASRRPELRDDLLELSKGLARCFVLPEGAEGYLIEERFGISRSFEPCGFFDPECMLRGIADFAAVREDGIYLMDYKTSHTIPPPSQVPIQAAAYAVLLGTAFPGKPVKACFLYVRYGVGRVWTFEPDQMAEMAVYFRNLIERMQGSDEYPAKISFFCHRCSYAYCCPELERYTRCSTLPAGPLMPEQAQELARELKALSVRGCS